MDWKRLGRAAVWFAGITGLAGFIVVAPVVVLSIVALALAASGCWLLADDGT